MSAPGDKEHGHIIICSPLMLLMVQIACKSLDVTLGHSAIRTHTVVFPILSDTWSYCQYVGMGTSLDIFITQIWPFVCVL